MRKPTEEFVRYLPLLIYWLVKGKHKYLNRDRHTWLQGPNLHALDQFYMKDVKFFVINIS